MTLLRTALAAFALALAVPAVVHGADRFMVARRAARRGERACARAQAPLDFNLVGLHWKGPGSVSGSGPLSRAGPLEPLAARRRPRTRTCRTPIRAEGRCAPGLEARQPVLDGPATLDPVPRSTGRVSRLRAYFVWSDPRAGMAATRPAARAARAAQPTIVRRAEWSADESIVRATPYYASAVRFAVVHHTAGTNSLLGFGIGGDRPRASSATTCSANGWNDIGYNFLVDKYGQVFEGRGGGITKNVVGAHAEGFNTGSTGVAVIGNYESQAISRRSAHRAREAARVASRRRARQPARQAHVDVRREPALPRRDEGQPARGLGAPGHGPTSCPGGVALRPAPRGSRRGVAGTGLPKLYNPVVNGQPRRPGPLHRDAHRGAALDRRRSATVDGDGRRHRAAGPARRSTGRGTPPRPDSDDFSHTRSGRARPPAGARHGARAAAARGDGPDRPPARGHAER